MLTFNHTGLDIGRTLSSLVSPLVSTIQEVFSPVQSMPTDALNYRIPGLSLMLASSPAMGALAAQVAVKYRGYPHRKLATSSKRPLMS